MGRKWGGVHWLPLVGRAQGKAEGSKKLVLWLLVSAWVGTGGGGLEVGAGGPLHFLLPADRDPLQPPAVPPAECRCRNTAVS